MYTKCSKCLISFAYNFVSLKDSRVIFGKSMKKVNELPTSIANGNSCHEVCRGQRKEVDFQVTSTLEICKYH